MPPAPSPRLLDKAVQSEPIHITFAADDFRATKPRWTGLIQPLDHPLLAHTHDPEFLKQHMQYADWDGKKTHVILDCKGHIIGVLITPPLPGEEWDAVVQAATDTMRAGFPTAMHGFVFGGRREEVGNIKASSARNTAAMEELLKDPSLICMATSPISLFEALCYPIFTDYHRTKQTLLQQNSSLRRTFARSPFTAVTANLGPVSVSLPHADAGNKADGMCLIGTLGNFDPSQGGHLVCWDYDLIICFPPGCSILIPSAVVTHSNTPIQDGEECFSLIQYSAGGLFRWVDNGFKSDRTWLASATAKDVERREEKHWAWCAAALKKFSLWKDVKVKNYSGRGRVEVWDAGDITDFSDLMEDESKPERAPAKKCCT
ncbi:hypothetical protein B0H14DRAFT_2633759 [Mycena olivaceomarginata]|nr:hypothetical protein B0H14DRAFT_2633759 [Mycena olivaceomarginata]